VSGGQWTAFITRRGGLIALVLLAVCAAAAPVAWAAKWVVQPSPRPPAATRAPLTAVSCPTRRFCAAVGSWSNEPYGGMDSAPLAETFNGRRWTLSLTPSMPTGWAGLFAVSCPSARFCVAVGQHRDGSGLVEQFNGARWSPMRLAADAPSLLSVSCRSRTWCVAGGRSGLATLAIEHFNGRAWRPQASPPVHVRGVEKDLTAVSCPRVTWCMAVGAVYPTAKAVSERWDGTRWTVVKLPGPASAYMTLNSVSCPVPKECVAGGSGPTFDRFLAERFTGTRWSVQPTPIRTADNTGAALTGISCVSVRLCIGVPALIHLRGSVWTAFPDVLPGGLAGVSCPSATFCVGVGTTYVISDDPDESAPLVARYP
jgi:hypothetical protein